MQQPESIGVGPSRKGKENSGRQSGQLTRRIAVDGNGRITAQVGEIVSLPLTIINRNPNQPRRVFDSSYINELAESIRPKGDVNTPAHVFIEPGGKSVMLIAGECRLRAMKLLNRPVMSCLVKSPPPNAKELLIESTVDNVNRRNMSPIEDAHSFKRMMHEFGMSTAEIAGRLGKKEDDIKKTLRLLTLVDEIQQLLLFGQLDKITGLELSRFPDWKQKELLNALKIETEERDYGVTPLEVKMIIRRYAAHKQIKARRKAPAADGGKTRGRKEKTHIELLMTIIIKACAKLKSDLQQLDKIAIPDFSRARSPHKIDLLGYMEEARDELNSQIRRFIAEKKKG